MRNKSFGASRGSLLLHLYQLEDKPNDIDILVSEENALVLGDIMARISTVQTGKSSDIFCSTYFYSYGINHFTVDIIGGFAIKHREGIYKLTLEPGLIIGYEQINGVKIPLSSLED